MLSSCYDARPIFYEQGWGDDDLFDAGDELLTELARDLDVTVAPCRTAWRRIRRQRPDLELHNLPDRVHPGTLGKYVNLCCFYAAITGQSPVGLPIRRVLYWPRLTDEQKQLASNRLKGMELHDPYVQALPSWMQRTSISAEALILEDDLARTFQTAAWDSYLEWRNPQRD